jgi:hypothetical protein
VGIFGALLAWEIYREVTFNEGRADRARLRAEHGERERERLSRVRWEERNHAERSFPCGIVVVPETEGAPPRPAPKPVQVPPPPSGPSLRPSPAPFAADRVGDRPRPPMPVPPALAEAQPVMRVAQATAVVLKDDLVFLLEDGVGEVEVAGQLPRTSITGVDVVDMDGTHVPEPVREEIEPSRLVFLVLRWTNEGQPDEDRFTSRSPWMAWRAARRLLEARRA